MASPKEKSLMLMAVMAKGGANGDSQSQELRA
jgi:hypothetical protein